MNIPQLKIDPKLPYHYLIAITIKHSKDLFETPTYSLKYLFRFTNDDVENVKKAVMMCSDKVFKTSQKEALEMFNCTEIVHSIAAMKVATSVNMGTMHHFSSSYPLGDEYFEEMVKLLPNSDEIKEKFLDSRIN